MWNPEKRPVSLDHEGSKVCGDPLKKVCLRTDGLKRALKSSANPARRLATRRPFGYIALRQRAGRPRRRFVSGEESPGSTELTVPGNARRRAIALAKAHQGQCHRKDTARLRTGKVERVRQERTAVLATGPAR